MQQSRWASKAFDRFSTAALPEILTKTRLGDLPPTRDMQNIKPSYLPESLQNAIGGKK
jgi:hypothetical protein